jgi:hypothetical protein
MSVAEDGPFVQRMREARPHPVRLVRDIRTGASIRSYDECHPHLLTFITTDGLSARLYLAHEPCEQAAHVGRMESERVVVCGQGVDQPRRQRRQYG